tara:strand:+ start:7105 stop:7434 length:330 start_codon:yes stop_codon:yes gene_type:complete
MARFSKGSDGFYHIKGGKYTFVKGSRAQVWHGTAYETTGGLRKGDLKMNKHGRVVSTKKSATAKKEKRLEKAGYFTKKGVFGFVKKSSSSKSRKSRRSRKSKRSKKSRK